MFVLGIFIMVFSYNLSNTGSEKKYKDESDNLEKKVRELKEYIEKSDNAIKLWNDEIKFKHADRPGLKVEAFRKLVEELKNTYGIDDLKVDLLTPEPRNDLGQLKYITVRSSNLSLGFSALTDIDVYQFLISLINQTPGYLQIKGISIQAIPEISNDVARSIASSGSKEVVTVKADLVWQDIQDLDSAATSASTAPTTPPSGNTTIR